MTDWQPIETAPRDGVEVLGFRADCGVLLMRWSSLAEFLTDSELEDIPEEHCHQEDWFYADFINGGRLEGDECPTHWMPLPAPPQVARMTNRLDALIAVLFGMGGKLFCCTVGAATLAAMVPHLFDMWKVM